MRLETAREAVIAEKSVPAEAPREDAQAKKPATAGKREDDKKRKNENHRQSSEAHNNFTDLIRSREDVFLATESTGVYKRPNSMRRDR